MSEPVTTGETPAQPIEVGAAGGPDEPPALRVESEAVAVHRLRRAGRVSALTLALVWVGGITFLWTAPSGTAAGCWAPFFLLGATAILLGRRHGAAVVGARQRGEPGLLVVGGGGVQVGSRLAWEPVIAGWTESFHDREEVVLETRSGTLVRAAVDGPHQGREVLRAAGVAPEQRAIAFRLGVGETGTARAFRIFAAMLLGPVAATLVVIFGATVFLGGSSSAVFGLVLGGIAAIAVLSLWALVRPLVTTTMSIGTDGVVVQRLGRRRFIPRAALQSVEAHEGDVVVKRAKGDPIRVRTSGRAEATAVVLRVREAIAAPAEGAGAPKLDRLDRRGRQVSEWLRDLRALASGPGGYRDASVDRRVLLDVVEDGGAPPERRIAAAAALSGSAEPDGQGFRTRVRVAAQACVDAHLREAIERAAEGELEEELVARAVRAAREG